MHSLSVSRRWVIAFFLFLILGRSEAHAESCANILRATQIELLKASVSAGGPKSGAEKGADALMSAGLYPRLSDRGWKISGWMSYPGPVRDERVKKGVVYADEIQRMNTRLAHATFLAAKQRRIPLTLGGDHSLVIGSYTGVSSFHGQLGNRIGFLQVDTHPDINTIQSSTTGNVHGQTISTLLGMKDTKAHRLSGYVPLLRPENIAYVGLRDIDPPEAVFLREMGIRYWTSEDVRRLGVDRVMDHALDVVNLGTAGFHFSYDLDSIDPEFAPGVSTPFPGGLNISEAFRIAERARMNGRMTSMDLVELNPDLDQGNRTRDLGVEVILQSMGSPGR